MAVEKEEKMSSQKELEKASTYKSAKTYATTFLCLVTLTYDFLTLK